MATRGLGSSNMSDEDKERIHSEGGKASGANFKNNPAKASDAGRKGAEKQPVEAKRRGGENSNGHH